MVSIIIATYNYARYISEAIYSLQQQTFKDWECIIVDDGSTDNTNEVVNQIIKNENRVSYHAIKNSGPSFARNVGVGLSKGNYILFLDADDLLQSDKILSHVTAFTNDANLDVAYGDVRYFNDVDKNPDNYFFSLHKNKKQWIPVLSGNGKELESKVLRENIMVTSSPLFKKEALIKIGLFDPALKKLEDWELFQRMIFANIKLQYVDAENSWVLMRAHQTSYSFDKDSMRSYLIPILQKNLLCSNVSFGNKVYLLFRMTEELTDLVILNLRGRKIPVRSYNRSFSFFSVVAAVLFSTISFN
ncbi:MAG: glycosyltransferase family 2 protein [Bacteroidetes bacterium]|nr:glycosyltransferase family 2 protein [Bacteroidota bacterium]